ncbi:hypothetical protein A0H81_10863 [Grifola frondosa]|uniref:Uncharacterized protein n=1 Tax=Grifola frondosa TaxID=5627 RepID=A0A1C7LX55_GRIFR|nr:hypothetical protein A0H81_10863 [Grifola frondosa]
MDQDVQVLKLTTTIPAVLRASKLRPIIDSALRVADLQIAINDVDTYMQQSDKNSKLSISSLQCALDDTDLFIKQSAIQSPSLWRIINYKVEFYRKRIVKKLRRTRSSQASPLNLSAEAPKLTYLIEKHDIVIRYLHDQAPVTRLTEDLTVCIANNKGQESPEVFKGHPGDLLYVINDMQIILPHERDIAALLRLCDNKPLRQYDNDDFVLLEELATEIPPDGQGAISTYLARMRDNNELVVVVRYPMDYPLKMEIDRLRNNPNDPGAELLMGRSRSCSRISFLIILGARGPIVNIITCTTVSGHSTRPYDVSDLCEFPCDPLYDPSDPSSSLGLKHLLSFNVFVSRYCLFPSYDFIHNIILIMSHLLAKEEKKDVRSSQAKPIVDDTSFVAEKRSSTQPANRRASFLIPPQEEKRDTIEAGEKAPFQKMLDRLKAQINAHQIQSDAPQSIDEMAQDKQIRDAVLSGASGITGEDFGVADRQRLV